MKSDMAPRKGFGKKQQMQRANMTPGGGPFRLTPGIFTHHATEGKLYSSSRSQLSILQIMKIALAH